MLSFGDNIQKISASDMLRAPSPTAAYIIEELSAILPYDMNIMDGDGYITASTDESRIGGFHEGAFLIINNKLDELKVYYDGEYEGCKRGINLPVMLNNTIIGVVGITGNVEEISKYGQIIKRMTEITAHNTFLSQKQNEENQAMALYIYDLLNRDVDYERASAYLNKYDLAEDLPYTVFVFSPANALDNTHIRKTLAVALNDEGVGISQLSLASLLEILNNYARNKGARFHVGDTVSSIRGIKHSYKTARRLRKYISADAAPQVLSYADNFIDIAIKKIEPPLQDRFINDCLGNCSAEYINDVVLLINTYEKCNGSITHIADELHLHKNTVQYRINKLRELSGYDLRSVEGCFYLKLLTMFLK